MDTLETLRSSPYFDHFDESGLERLASCVEPIEVSAGLVLFPEGEMSFDIYLIESGEVSLLRDSPFGTIQLAILGAGAVFGEVGFIDRQGRSAAAQTEADCRLFLLPAAALLERAGEDEPFERALYWAFWKSLSGKLRTANNFPTRFFPDAKDFPARRADQAPKESSPLHVGMPAKRDLFAEQKLSSMEINLLASLSREERYNPGQNIFCEGDVGDRMFVVLEGTVMISRIIPGAGEEALSFLERGDYFGEMALIDDRPRSADVYAHHDGAVVLAISNSILKGLLDIRKVSSLRMLKLLCGLVVKRLRDINEKIVGWHVLAGGDSEPPDVSR